MLIGKVFSDPHGQLPIITETFDLLLICGDITPADWAHTHNINAQKRWLFREFKEWVDKLPFRDEWSKVFIIPGNHDHVFENLNPYVKDDYQKKMGDRVEILIHEEKVFECLDELKGLREVRIFGTPYCKVFGRWAFMKDDDYLTELYNQIPDGLDILITHDPPALNELGVIHEGMPKGREAGNEILAKRLLEIKPKYVFGGHIHSGNHKYEEYEGMMMANVSLVNERYMPVNDVLTFGF